jgi:hypothetical protein
MNKTLSGLILGLGLITTIAEPSHAAPFYEGSRPAAAHVFSETLKDPEFVADAKRSRLDTDPLTGEEIEKIVLQLFKIDPGMVNQLRDILK